MKIEISEVFVTHTDAITTESRCTPIGIAALDAQTNIHPNIRRTFISRILSLLTFFSRF
jgi:hypothetical protein